MVVFMGTLSYKNKVYTFKTSRESISESASDRNLAKAAGFNYDPELKKYWTASTATAIKLRAHGDESVKEYLKTLTRYPTPCPKRLRYPSDLKPRDYQLSGARHLLSYNWTYLGDDAGLGKTITAIIALNSDEGKTLIVCPPSLKYNWERELSKWMTGKRTVRILKPEDFVQVYEADVLILPDSLLDRRDVKDALALHSFKWLIVDEAHRFKEVRTQRTQSLFGRVDEDASDTSYVPLFKLSKRVVAMSGTPMPNRPVELYPVLNAIAPDTIDFAGFTQYAIKYCGAYESRYGMVTTGESNLDELRERVRTEFMLRRRKSQVLKELPAKTRQIIYLDAGKSSLKKWEAEALKKYTIEDITESDNPLGELAELRREIGLSMVKPATEFIRDFLESSRAQKIVVFAWHRDVIKNLSENLLAFNPLVIQGGTDSKRKDDIVQRFQNSKTNRLIILNIEAGGVGHTLTAASRVVFVEPSWVDTVNDQAEDRLHRMGQKDNVLSQYLVSSGGFMEYLLSRVFSKQKNVDIVMS